jgi:hypothetical protein
MTTPPTRAAAPALTAMLAMLPSERAVFRC